MPQWLTIKEDGTWWYQHALHLHESDELIPCPAMRARSQRHGWPRAARWIRTWITAPPGMVCWDLWPSVTMVVTFCECCQWSCSALCRYAIHCRTEITESMARCSWNIRCRSLRQLEEIQFAASTMPLAAHLLAKRKGMKSQHEQKGWPVLLFFWENKRTMS